MTREGQDGINSDAAGMDHNIPVVAYYISGRYAWTQAEINMFPNSAHVRIATQSSVRDGTVIDCETGDATPAQAAEWVHQRRADGYAYPMVYTSIANQAAVIAALNAIHEPMPLWWIAHFDNKDTLPAGFTGKQYADPGPLDKSIWADYIPGVDGVEMALTPTDADVIWDHQVPNPHTGDLAWAKDLLWEIDLACGRIEAALGTMSTSEAAILAAVQAITSTSGTVSDTQMATLTATLEAALPSYTVSIAPKV